VRDEHSLERYLYQRWGELQDVGARRLIEILAAAAAYGVAVPFESLARDPELELALYGRVSAAAGLLLSLDKVWMAKAELGSARPASGVRRFADPHAASRRGQCALHAISACT
jgi:hypothetical protein